MFYSVPIMSTKPIPDTFTLWRFPDLVARGIVNNRMSLRRWMALSSDPFPASIQLGPNVIAWRADEVIEWLESRRHTPRTVAAETTARAEAR